MQTHHAVRHRRDGGIVRDENDGCALRAIEFVNDAQNVLSRFRVEVAGRFVAQQDGGIVGERARDGDALLLPSRKLRGKMICAVTQANAFEQL